MRRTSCQRQFTEIGPHLIPCYLTFVSVTHRRSPHRGRADRLAIAIAWWKNIQNSLIVAMGIAEFGYKNNIRTTPIYLRDAASNNRDRLARNAPDVVVSLL